MKVHKADGTTLDTDFPGDVPEAVTYHAPCHLRAQNIGLQEPRPHEADRHQGHARRRVLGHRRHVGLRGRELRDRPQGRREAGRRHRARPGNDVVAGDCHLANGGIAQETGQPPVHPIQVVARAYGIPEELTHVTPAS